MTDATRLDHFLTYRLHRVARLSDRDTSAAYLARCGIHQSDARCLAAIGAFEPLSINDLARRANQDKGQASRAVKALVELGLVAKDASTEDARSVVLTLTRKGRVLQARTMQLIAQRNAQIFAVLTGSEQAQLGEMLDRVARAIDDG